MARLGVDTPAEDADRSLDTFTSDWEAGDSKLVATKHSISKRDRNREKQS